MFTARDIPNPAELLTDLPRVITEEMNDDLTRPVSDEEIKAAVFSMDPNKTPGLDGFSVKFYRKYWEVIGPQIFHEIIFFPNIYYVCRLEQYKLNHHS